MAHGQPDFGMYASKSTTFGVSDVGELAARLGSIVTFDRRGDVVWLDGFESGISHWGQVLGGTGQSIDSSPVTSRNGALSVKLTAGSDGTHQASLERSLARPRPSKIGFEYSFAFPSNAGTIELFLRTRDGVKAYEFGIRYNQPDSTIEYLGSDRVYAVLASGVTLFNSTYTYNTMKLVVDLETWKYERAIVNETEHDLTAYSGWSSADTLAIRLLLGIYNIGRTGENNVVYIDDAIVTQNEP